MASEEYREAIRRVVDQAPPLSPATRARLSLLLRSVDPAERLRVATALRPDLPVGIVRQEVATDGT
jgi:hypothetical protein